MAIVEVSNAVIYPRTVVVWSLCQKFRNGGKDHTVVRTHSEDTSCCETVNSAG